MIRAVIIAVAGALMLVLFAFQCDHTHANASTLPTMDGLTDLVKVNDLAVIRAGTWAFVACGISTDPAHISRVGPCKPGQDPIYASYRTLAADIAAGKLVAGQVIIFDQEGWAITPAYERAHPFRFLRLAALLAHANGITIIEAPVGNAKNGQQLAEQVYAARFADYVELQDQYLDGNPAKYIAVVTEAVAAIRKVNTTVPVLAGLATDAGGVPVTAKQMYAAYEGVHPLIAGAWINSNKWAKGTGCAPSGCPLVARAFLARIGGSS